MSTFTRAGVAVLAAAMTVGLSACYAQQDAKPSQAPRSPMAPRTSIAPVAKGMAEVPFPDVIGSCKASGEARAQGETLRTREYECTDPQLSGALQLFAEKADYTLWRSRGVRIQQRGSYECSRVNAFTSCGFPLADGAMYATTAGDQKPEGLHTFFDALVPLVKGGAQPPQTSGVPKPEESAGTETPAPATTS